MNNSTVILKNVSTGYGLSDRRPKVITSDVSASLAVGQLTCLLGPNGAGKSTMLRTLSATLPPVGGEIELLGRPLAAYTPRELSKAVGVVLTDRVTADNLTVENLVELGRSPYTGFFGRLSAEDRQTVDDAIRVTGTGALRHRSVATLSDGERQKVMIAKVLAQQTPIILLDEPTAFLDYPSKVEFMLLLRELCRRQGKTVFMSTHDVDLALLTADFLWLLSPEIGLVTGAPEDLALDGALGRCFAGRGVRFDTSTGLFDVDSDTDGAISVGGSGDRFRMVCKALRRIGLRPVATDRDAEITVGDAYRFEGKSYPTIAALTEAVSQSRAERDSRP